MFMPCTPEKQFPGAWPDFDSPSGSTQELLVACSGSSAIHLHKKPAPLRIIVPPTEYCPFSTDLTLPITPLSLPTPVSSSCFTFSDAQESVNQDPPTAAPILLSSSQNTADFASPTSSQFLLMPPTPHLEDVECERAICVSPLFTSPTAHEPIRTDPTKCGNPHPWEVSSSTWLSDLGGHTETDRMFHHNFLGMNLVDTDSSPASTPALSPSAVSPSSQISSLLAHNLPTSFPAALFPYSPTISPQPSSPTRLDLQPTGTDTFPSTMDSLEAWRETIAAPSERPCSPLTEDTHAPVEDPVVETPIHPFTPIHPQHPRRLSPRPSRVPRSQTFMKRARMFGGRVKQLVTRQGVNKHRSTMDRGVSFSIVTSQDSDNDSVILITAPPPPYDVCTLAFVPHSAAVEEHVRSRTVSEYSSAVQAGSVEVATTGMTESSSRHGGRNRNTLRRLSLAALSTIKRH